MKSKYLNWLWRCCFFTIGFLLCLFLDRYEWHQPSSDVVFENSSMLRDDSYSYVSPLLMCGLSEQLEPTAFEDLKAEVVAQVEAITLPSDNYSVYFRELDSGQWFSINGEQTYAPASLLKLPLFIAYLKMAESNPGLMDITLNVPTETNWNEGLVYQPANPIVPGQSYTIRELLLAMINDSDNNAVIVLRDAIDETYKNEIFSDLGLSIPSEDPTEQSMTAKDYSHFFRVLYNASYLNHESSQKALEMMIPSRFEAGLAGGITEETEIAEKFGERTWIDTESGDKLYELHDCGIIYPSPGEPYLLCVMTKSPNGFEHLSDILQTISRTVFNEMVSPHAELLML